MAVLAATTWCQIAYWWDPVTLCTHALASTADNGFMRNQLGGTLLQQGKPREAIEHFEMAAQWDPAMVQPQYNLGVAYANLGQLDQAAAHYRRALAINDGYAAAHNNLGLVETNRGHYAEAKMQLRRAIEIDPSFADAYMNLALACLKSGDPAGAISSAQRALELIPSLTNGQRIIAGPRSPRPSSGSDSPVDGRVRVFRMTRGSSTTSRGCVTDPTAGSLGEPHFGAEEVQRYPGTGVKDQDLKIPYEPLALRQPSRRLSGAE